jgi:hypothetical protein
VPSTKALGSAAPVGTFEPQYADEGLTVSKCEHRVVKSGACSLCDGWQPSNLKASHCSLRPPEVNLAPSCRLEDEIQRRDRKERKFFPAAGTVQMSRCSGFFVRKLIANAALASMLAGAASAPAFGRQAAQPNPSYGAALQFGMNAAQVSQVLGVPLTYVRGHPGNELFFAIPNVKGSALSIRSDALYLQFRKGRLSGWKGDWGTINP